MNDQSTIPPDASEFTLTESMLPRTDRSCRDRTRRFIGRAKCIPKDPNKLFLPYQSRWILDDSPRKLAVKSRQIGWTWATAYRLVRKMTCRGAGTDSWLMSRDEMQGKLLLEDCKAWAKVLRIGALSVGAEVIDELGNKGHYLRFANGRRVMSLSSNPDTQAGKRGTRIIDEFALLPNPRKAYTVASPGITWGGNIELISTQRGADNYFNELINEIKHGGNPKDFSLHEVSLQDALDQGLLYKLQCKWPLSDPRQQMDEAAYFEHVRRGCPDEASFREEYMCQPAQDRSAFLSHEMIASCEYPPDEPWQYHMTSEGVQWADGTKPKLSTHLRFAGVDVGRDNDLTVIWIVEKMGDVMYTRAVITLEKAPFDVQEAVLNEWINRCGVARCCIDQTGMGRQFAERAQRRWSEFKVEGVTFTEATKEELAYLVRATFESKRVRIPNDPIIHADLRALKKEASDGCHVRFTADRTKHGHADRFWALALALKGAAEYRGAWASVA